MYINSLKLVYPVVDPSATRFLKRIPVVICKDCIFYLLANTVKMANRNFKCVLL